MKRSAIGFAFVVLAAAQQPAALASEPIVIKFSHVTAKNTPKGEAAEYFKKLAEDRTDARVRVEVYPNSILYKDGEEMEMLQMGAVQMLAPSLAKFGPLGVKEFEVFDLPFLFDGYDDLHKVTQGPAGQALLKKLEAKGITGLAFWDNGFKVMSANRPLRTPADFKGLKMRIQSSKVLDQEMRDLGAIPQVTALSEAYQALQTGVVDGTENPPSNLYTQKMYEVQKFVSVSNHGYLGYAVIVNRKFWSALPEDVRLALESAMRDTTEFVNRIAKKDNDDALEAVRKSGKSQVYTLTAEERLSWKRALLAVHREQAARIGTETLGDIYKATDFDPRKLF